MRIFTWTSYVQDVTFVVVAETPQDAVEAIYADLEKKWAVSWPAMNTATLYDNLDEIDTSKPGCKALMMPYPFYSRKQFPRLPRKAD
jgi:hypothetical protein